ncbi:hypothetical protein BJX61DRAFT_316996 [Aspergillus egyptiacus]|nr:hypothetical protein BJX61DRAFT_316996 [Aspergillus egyptiacus]
MKSPPVIMCALTYIIIGIWNHLRGQSPQRSYIRSGSWYANNTSIFATQNVDCMWEALILQHWVLPLRIRAKGPSFILIKIGRLLLSRVTARVCILPDSLY